MPRTRGFDPEQAQYKAMHLFWQKGYAHTSMEDLLGEMAISRSSFYTTFGDKRQLYEDVMERFARLGELAAQVLSAEKAIRQLLLDFFEFSFRGTGDTLGQGCLLVNSVLELRGNDPALADKASDLLANIEARLSSAFDRAIERNELPAGTQASALAAYFMAMIKGLRVMAKEGRDIDCLRATFLTALEIPSLQEKAHA